MRRVQELLKELDDPSDLSEIKERILSLFRKPEIEGRRKPETLLPCEWQMGKVRRYSDYEAAVLTPKMSALRKQRIKF